MDKLAEALVEAIKAGTHLAMPALVGYYVVRVVDSISAPLAFVGFVTIVGRTVIKGMQTYYEGENGKYGRK